jgi:hypothetical protein
MPLPELKIVFPYILIKKLANLMKIAELTSGEINWYRFHDNFSKFRELYEKHKEKILEEIANILGFDWVERDIIIYPIPEDVAIPSISHPLLLKIREDPYFNLYMLIHEFLHRHIESRKELEKISMKKADLVKAHAIIEFLTVEIISKLFGEEKAQELHKKEKEIVKTRDMEKSYKLANEFRKKFNPSLPSPERFLVLIHNKLVPST